MRERESSWPVLDPIQFRHARTAAGLEVGGPHSLSLSSFSLVQVPTMASAYVMA